MWRGIAIIMLGLAMIGCKSTEVKEEPTQPKKTTTQVKKTKSMSSHSNACDESKGRLDDFGPGVEECRRQKAGELDDF